jgi:hypothetical protein
MNVSRPRVLGGRQGGLDEQWQNSARRRLDPGTGAPSRGGPSGLRDEQSGPSKPSKATETTTPAAHSLLSPSLAPFADSDTLRLTREGSPTPREGDRLSRSVVARRGQPGTDVRLIRRDARRLSLAVAAGRPRRSGNMGVLDLDERSAIQAQLLAVRVKPCPSRRGRDWTEDPPFRQMWETAALGRSNPTL